MEKDKLPGESSENKTDSIFTEDDFINQGYDKHIRQARNAIFAAAILISISILIYAFQNEGAEFLWLDILIYGVFVLGFVALGFWTKKKPYTAIVMALALYALFIILNAALDLSTIYKGIIVKVIIIVLLVKGLKDAKEAQERKEMIQS